MRNARALILLLTFAACHSASHSPSTRAAGSASGHSATSAGAPVDTIVSIRALELAEQRRDSVAVAGEALSSRQTSIRRSAARALARIADARAAELLTLAVADEDPEVSTWAAYGLGYACAGREPKTVATLIARAASLTGDEHANAPLASPSEAIADALGRCGGAEAEHTLRAWLAGPKARAEAAALALGRVAAERGQLEDTTLVALLDAADRIESPLEGALYPCTRLATLNASTSERVRALALRAIASKRPGIEFAVRALARTGEAGRAALGALLTDATLSAGLRAEAARELSALGSAGQQALWAAFDKLSTQTTTDVELESASYGPFSALLDALEPPLQSSGSGLKKFTELALGEHDSASLRRRKLHVRCTAAELLAGSNYQSPRLRACDMATESRTRELAVLRVIARDKLQGSRKQAYLQLSAASDNVLREAALGLLAAHNELGEAYRVLADALAAKSLGVVASAAQILSYYPERADRVRESASVAHTGPSPDPSVVQALTQAYASTVAQHNVEVQGLLLDAIGSLEILSLKGSVNTACTSDNPSLREHAEKALRLLGEQGRQCHKFAVSAEPSRVDPTEAAGSTLLTLETDAGTLTVRLDPTLAPSAVARVVGLAQAGFYDGILVHRVVPGFVAQFGDPSGDGYSGDNKPPLRCETAPVPFEPGAVGVALSGRDTGSSQLFVTLGRYPHLDGDYARIGQAGPGWDRVAAGDRILHVSVTRSAAP